MAGDDHTDVPPAQGVSSEVHVPAPDVVRQGTHGRHPVLKQAIARFVADVGKLPASAIQARWKDEVEASLRGRTPSTRKAYIMQYRAALTDALGPRHPALGVVSARGLFAEISAAKREAPTQQDPGSLMGAGAQGAAAGPSGARPVGRPSVLRDAVASFVERLRGVSTPAQLDALWGEELAKHGGKADRTLKLYVVQYYRPAIRRAFGDDHPALSVVRTPDELIDRVRTNDRARVAESHRHLVEVEHWREIVARGAGLLRSREPLFLAVGLLCVTGRRPYEVFCTGRFAPAPVPGGPARAASRWTVMFAGQAKTKGRPGTRQDAYEIPVLAEARAVLAAFAALRASPEGREWADLDNQGFSRLTTGVGTDLRIPLAEAVEDTFGGLWPAEDRLTPRSLRPLYAEVAYRHFGSATVSKNSFFSAALGHTMQDLETSLSYMDYHLSDDARASASAARLAGRLAAEPDRRSTADGKEEAGR